ncbi:MAG TPA: hypothetical protein VFV10_15075 [Gammaproteobacteria bacterium]|nr:hypothetical protein [Gammaproteobacteria bacterium]
MLDFGAWLQDTRVSVTIQSVEWIIPLLQSIHIVMIGIVFISSLMITLRVLGRVRADEPFQAVWRRFAPWMWTGLVVMALTGAVLVVAEPIREFTALSFWLKMALVAIGVVTSAVFGRTMGRRAASAVPRTGSGAGTAEFRATGAASGSTGASSAEFSAASKAVAIATVAIWLAIIFLGRAIAYDVEVWGKLSLHG